MAITIDTDDEQCRVTIAGDLTIFTAQEWKTALLAPLVDSGNIEVDLSAVSDIDTAGLQLLIMLKLEAFTRDKTLQLIGHSAAVREIIDLCDLGAFFGDPVVIQSQAA